jgi:hypothetical protein
MERKPRKKGAKPGKKEAKPRARDTRLYTLEVFIFGGPVSDKFLEANPVICRTIQIRGDQTLADLHEAIFIAFDREEEHLYEFQVGGKGPMDPKAKRYVLSTEDDDPWGEGRPAGDVRRTRIGSLKLEVDQAFGYWFDFGDDWWHQINVLGIDDEAPPGIYPCITERVGESPPQYPDWDDEEGEEEDEEE